MRRLLLGQFEKKIGVLFPNVRSPCLVLLEEMPQRSHKKQLARHHHAKSARRAPRRMRAFGTKIR
jgi:hypothetical protein